MATYEFTVAPNVVAPVGSPELGLSNIRHVIAPAGRPAALLARMAGSYTAMQKARISQCLFDLIDAGILAKLDVLLIRGLTAADSLINWASLSGAAVNQSATAWSLGAGFTGDGVADWIDPSAIGYNKYLQADASVFGYLPTDQQSGEYLLGVVASGGGNNIQIQPGGGGSAIARVNSTTSISTSYVGSRKGLWCAANLAGNVGLWKDGVQIIAPTAVTTSAPSTSGIGFLRNSAAYGTYTAAAFGYGAYLTPTEQATLSAAIAAMLAVI